MKKILILLFLISCNNKPNSNTELFRIQKYCNNTKAKKDIKICDYFFKELNKMIEADR